MKVYMRPLILTILADINFPVSMDEFLDVFAHQDMLCVVKWLSVWSLFFAGFHFLEFKKIFVLTLKFEKFIKIQEANIWVN